MTGSAHADHNTPASERRPARLSVAVLRRVAPIRMWGGQGCGRACDFCRVVVSDTEIEYEVEADLDGARITLHFHRRCHDAWKAGLEPSRSDAGQEGQEEEMSEVSRSAAGSP